MHLPIQAGPVMRTEFRPCRSPASQVIGARDGLECEWQRQGVGPSDYGDCYNLTGPAQRVCLLMSTNGG
jgi:hypothetical protein